MGTSLSRHMGVSEKNSVSDLRAPWRPSVDFDADFSVLAKVGLSSSKPRCGELESGHRRASRTVPHFCPVRLDLHHEQVWILRPARPPDLLLLVPQRLGSLCIAVQGRLADDGVIDLLFGIDDGGTSVRVGLDLVVL